MTYKIIEVTPPSRSYPVVIGAGAREQFEELFNQSGEGRAFWVTDRNVADAWGEDLGGLCSHSATDMIILPPGEEQKNFATVERICQILVEMGAERGDTLVACGGGVVGDIVGFAAAIYRRGVAFVQVPTTLLAMVDASVGGKTGVDLPQGKNLIGAFHQPQFVVIDVDFLKTLDEREFLSGYAEVVKTALIGNPGLFDEISGDLGGRFFAKEPESLVKVIEACVRFKAEVVTRDEKENDLRRILNFGHTLGHALEAAGEYSTLKHGEAIFWGMSAAVDLSDILGMMDQTRADEINAALETHLRNLPWLHFQEDEILELIGHDKKVAGGVPHFVLLEEVGKPVITDQVKSEHLAEALDRLGRRMSKNH